jgi:adenosylcobinamide amidohydrolase
MNTPWGRADNIESIAPGITLVSTPSHGGIKVSRPVMDVMPKGWQQDDGWYEEDCEALKVILAFPHFFPQVDIARAKMSFEFWFNQDGTYKRRGAQ